jgi:hypothetical protein
MLAIDAHRFDKCLLPWCGWICQARFGIQFPFEAFPYAIRHISAAALVDHPSDLVGADYRRAQAMNLLQQSQNGFGRLAIINFGQFSGGNGRRSRMAAQQCTV